MLLVVVVREEGRGMVVGDKRGRDKEGGWLVVVNVLRITLVCVRLILLSHQCADLPLTCFTYPSYDLTGLPYLNVQEDFRFQQVLGLTHTS